MLRLDAEVGAAAGGLEETREENEFVRVSHVVIC